MHDGTSFAGFRDPVIHSLKMVPAFGVGLADDPCMGIRYYAYAFDKHLTGAALADPYSVIGVDPLADAWGLPPGFTSGVTDFTPSVPERDLLYLDKAWETFSD